jgi:hypothetical protein
MFNQQILANCNFSLFDVSGSEVLGNGMGLVNTGGFSWEAYRYHPVPQQPEIQALADLPFFSTRHSI